MPRQAGKSDGSSPHTRGAPRLVRLGAGQGGIIPAYAGSTRRDDRRPPCGLDHPRIRGEHSNAVRRPSITPGSSPHTRGAPTRCRVWPSACRIIPAYAGSTGRRRGPAWRRTDHPRIRGEHDAAEVGEAARPGSSPHTRGALEQDLAGVAERRIIPAYAGSTWSSRLSQSLAADHPRIRGEHWPITFQTLDRSGSSPHTRGARLRQARPRRTQGIIPAYAGSTPASLASAPPLPDHPRIRGEHLAWHRLGCSGDGSSPHTRGAHLEIPAIPRIAAVIIPVFLYPSPTPQEEADRSMVLLTLS